MRRAGVGQADREIVIGVIGILNESGSGGGKSCTAKHKQSENRRTGLK